MSKDPFGHDPLGLDPIQAIQQVNPLIKTQRAIDAYRHNIVVRGVYVADRYNPAPVGPTVGDDGKELTFEERQRIAASRAPYNPDTFGRTAYLPDGTQVSLGYNTDLKERKVEPIGASAQAEIEKQPEFRIVQPKVLPDDIPKATE